MTDEFAVYPSLRGQVAFVSGGASGLGAEFVAQLARQGVRVAFVDVQDDDVAVDDGLPDGLTVDREGGVWVALYGGSAVRRYSPDGKLDEVLELPVSQVTACTFGGPALDELYITTSRLEVPDGDQPAAGSVFWAEPGVVGLPPTPFAG